jgi:hypothetical protein
MVDAMQPGKDKPDEESFTIALHEALRQNAPAIEEAFKHKRGYVLKVNDRSFNLTSEDLAA